MYMTARVRSSTLMGSSRASRTRLFNTSKAMLAMAVGELETPVVGHLWTLVKLYQKTSLMLRLMLSDADIITKYTDEGTVEKHIGFR